MFILLASVALEIGSCRNSKCEEWRYSNCLIGEIAKTVVSHSAADLAGNFAFAHILCHLAASLRSVFDESPRLARTLATHQRWMMSQGAYALHLERDPADPASGLTVSRLRELIVDNGVASRNTVQSYIEELLSYRFIRYVPDNKVRRPRPLEPTEVTQAAMLRWLTANLAALDVLDSGRRVEMLAKLPQIFDIAQPRIARTCIENPDWREPPQVVAICMWTDAGGLVIDEFFGRLDLNAGIDGRYDIGRVDAKALAEHFMMSRTHLQRLLRKGVEFGSLGWTDEKRTHMWMSRSFIDQYCAWQAIKFSIVDEAYEWALAQIGHATEVGA